MSDALITRFDWRCRRCGGEGGETVAGHVWSMRANCRSCGATLDSVTMTKAEAPPVVSLRRKEKRT